MATHASVLTWEFPWTELPGGLQSMWATVHHKAQDTTQRLNNQGIPDSSVGKESACNAGDTPI